MRIQDLVTLYDFNYWANGRILAASASLSQEQFVKPSSFSFGSLHKILIHSLDTEYGWRMLCQHNTMTDVLTDESLPTVDAIAERWREEEQTMRAYLASLSDDDLDGMVRYTNDNGVSRERLLWQYLIHILNHATQHRSEAAEILTGYGQSPGDLDFTLFLNERV